MLLKVSLVFIIINKLNADQALIQIKRLEKVQHIDSAQRLQTDGPLYIGFSERVWWEFSDAHM